MLPEYQRAIALGQSVKAVRDELNRRADQEHQQRKREIEQGFSSACFMLQALKEPTDTEMHMIAKSYVRTYRTVYREEYQEQQKLLNDLRKEVEETDDRTGQASETAVYAEIPPIEP